jgi:hypothetical protein
MSDVLSVWWAQQMKDHLTELMDGKNSEFVRLQRANENLEGQVEQLTISLVDATTKKADAESRMRQFQQVSFPTPPTVLARPCACMCILWYQHCHNQPPIVGWVLVLVVAWKLLTQNMYRAREGRWNACWLHSSCFLLPAHPPHASMLLPPSSCAPMSDCICPAVLHIQWRMQAPFLELYSPSIPPHLPNL